jgi:hypothetical protein
MQKIPRTIAALNLTRKAIFAITPVFICFFLIIGYLTERVLRSQIINNMEEAVSVLVEDEAKDIDVHFKRLEGLGRKSKAMIHKWLENKPNPPDKAFFTEKYKQIDGALRTNIDAFVDKDISAIFLSNRAELNDEIRQGGNSLRV